MIEEKKRKKKHLLRLVNAHSQDALVQSISQGMECFGEQTVRSGEHPRAELHQRVHSVTE